MSLTSYILKLRNSIKTGIYSVSATVLRNKCLNRIDFPTPPYIVKSFFLENQGISNVSSINISEERAIEMDISLYLVRK